MPFYTFLLDEDPLTVIEPVLGSPVFMTGDGRSGQILQSEIEGVLRQEKKSQGVLRGEVPAVLFGNPAPWIGFPHRERRLLRGELKLGSEG